MSSEGAQLYYGSKVSLQSSHGMWLTVRNKSVYLSPEELPGSALTLLNLKDPYSAGPVRYTDTILLQVRVHMRLCRDCADSMRTHTAGRDVLVARAGKQ